MFGLPVDATRVLPFVIVVVTVMIATITDLRTLKVHNWLTFPVLLSGLVFHWVVNGPQGLLLSFLNASLVLAMLLLPYILGAIGAGDVKLVAALAAWLGTSMTFGIAALGLFATGVYSLAQLVRQKRLTDAWIHFKVSVYRMQALFRTLGSDVGGETIRDMAQSPEGRARLVPFSGMLAFGTAVVFAWKFIA